MPKVYYYQFLNKVITANRKFPENHILESDKNGKDLIKSIFRARTLSEISTPKFIEYSAKCFEHMKTQHKKGQILTIISTQMQSDKTNYFKDVMKIPKKCEVHPAQIKKMFRIIAHKVLPKAIYGTSGNFKKILKAFDNILRLPKSEEYSLTNLTNGLNIEKIPFVKYLKNEDNKKLAMIEFLSWLFDYFITILGTSFYINLYNQKRVFFNKNISFQDKKKYIKKMKDKQIVLKDPKENNKSLNNRLCLIAKNDDYRPIIKMDHKIKNDPGFDKMMKALRSLLSFADSGYKSQKNLLDVMRLYSEKKKSGKIKQVYIITADIRNAFGSIKQSTLMTIIKTLFSKLPDKLEFIEYKTKMFNSPSFKTNYEYMPQNWGKKKNRFYGKNTLSFTKQEILENLKDIIFNSQLNVNNVSHILLKGVVQGGPLSNVFCDIYYNHMRKIWLEEFEQKGTLLTYVDDSLFITDDISTAVRYLRRIRNGIPSYNCFYNLSKLSTNFRDEESTKDYSCDKIKYLGWSIDSKTLEIEPIYSETRYHFSQYRHNSQYNKFLMKKMEGGTIKLKQLIFDKTINSKNQIFSNAEKVSSTQATICLTLISKLQINKNIAKIIFRLILSVNRRTIKKILRFTTWDNIDCLINGKVIWAIFWRSYHNTFKKKSDIFRYFSFRLRKRFSNNSLKKGTETEDDMK